jgi:hypothetical protein
MLPQRAARRCPTASEAMTRSTALGPATPNHTPHPRAARRLKPGLRRHRRGSSRRGCPRRTGRSATSWQSSFQPIEQGCAVRQGGWWPAPMQGTICRLSHGARRSRPVWSRPQRRLSHLRRTRSSGTWGRQRHQPLAAAPSSASPARWSL